MLDYAANARKYWPEDRIRSLAAVQYEARGGVDEALGRILEPAEEQDDSDTIETFWDGVAENLRTGRLRLLFVAEELPSELRRVIEFLNEQMRSVEVLGVEIQQYVGEGLRALVPRVIGQSESTRESKAARRPPKRRVTFDTFMERVSDHVAGLFNDVIEEAEELGLTVKWTSNGFGVRLPLDEGRCTVLYGYPHGDDTGRDLDYFEGYVNYLPGGLLRDELAAAFSRVDGIRVRGEYTYELHLGPGDLGSGRAMWQAVKDAWARSRERVEVRGG